MLEYCSIRRFSNTTTRIVASTLLLFFCSLQLTQAQIDSRWIAVDGNWSDSANWDNGVPIGNFNAIIDSTAGVIIQDVGPFELESLELNGSSAKLVLDNLLIVGCLDWQEGEIGGDSEFRLVTEGQIINGVLETTFSNFGFVQLGADGQFGRLDSTTGAVWNNETGSVLEVVDGSQIGTFFKGGPGRLNTKTDSQVFLNGPSTSLSWDVVNDGTIEINESIILFVRDYEQANTARLILNTGTADFFQDTSFQGKVSGNGTLINLSATGFEAQLEPGGSEIGQINVGFLPMTPATVSNFQIGPNLTSDVVCNFGGGLQLDGTLNVEALPGATPGTYTLFTFNNAFMLQFENIQLGDVPDGFKGSLLLDAAGQAVKLNVEAITPVILLGDANQDGVVNLLDVAFFIDLLANGQFQAEADINQDGNVDLLDVGPFVALLQNG